MRVRTLALCLTMACPFVSLEARAADAPADAPSAPLALTLELDDSGLDPELVRRAIELELKRPVAIAGPDSPAGPPPAASLSVRVHADHTASVSYQAAGGVNRTRSIQLPQEAARSAEVIALLSGNLTRDEAAELLAGLGPKDQPEKAAEASPPAAAATPSEPPKKPAPPATAATAPKTKPGTATEPSRDPSLLTQPYPAFNLSLYGPISLISHAERHVINGELGLAFSHIGQLEGVGFDLFAFHTEHDVHGVSFATFYNGTVGVVRGFTGSAIYNRSGDVQGGGLGGIVTFARDGYGIEAAGIVSNVRDFQGLQVAGIANSAGKFHGIQLAGVTNVADELTGAQIGIVNVAGQVHGVQLGLVNVSKHTDGAAIGLVSVAGNGRVQPALWASSFMPINAALKFTVGWFYSQFGVGYRPAPGGSAAGTPKDTYTFELGLGGHFAIGRLFIEPGLHYSEKRFLNQASESALSEDVHYRVAAGLDLGAVSPFVGAGATQRLAFTIDAPDSHPASFEGFGGLAFF